MINKKDQLFFISKICITCFALGMLAAYVYCLATSREMFRVEFIGQLLIMDIFLFIGGLLGLTDIVIRLKSAKIRVLIVGIILYVLSLYLLTFVSFNPLTSMIKFAGYTFLFTCITFLVAEFFAIWQKKKSDNYMKLIEQIQQKYVLSNENL